MDDESVDRLQLIYKILCIKLLGLANEFIDNNQLRSMRKDKLAIVCITGHKMIKI